MDEPPITPALAAILCFLFMVGAIVTMSYIDKMSIVSELGNGE